MLHAVNKTLVLVTSFSLYIMAAIKPITYVYHGLSSFLREKILCANTCSITQFFFLTLDFFLAVNSVLRCRCLLLLHWRVDKLHPYLLLLYQAAFAA